MPSLLPSTRMVSVCLALAAGTAQSQTWIPLGPGPATNGQLEGMEAQGNPVTGAVRIAVPHPLDPDVLYVGTINGGVWRTSNAMAMFPSWTPLTDNADSLSIGALSFDRLDPTYQTLVAGMGRFSSFASTGGARSGLLRTTDGGDSWTPLGMTALAERNISSVAARGAVILVAVNTGTQPGLYRSSNTGQTFEYLSGSPTSFLPSGAVPAMEGDPATNGRFYCTVIGANGGVFKSLDFGQTWLDVTIGDTGTVIGLSSAGNAKIAFHNSPNNNVVYVSVVIGGELAGVYRSADQGGDWTDLGFPVTHEDTCDLGVNPGGQGNIHQSLAADPLNPNIVYVGGDRQPTSFCDGGFFPNASEAQDYDGRLFRGDAARPPQTRWLPLTHTDTGNHSAPHADSRSLAVNPLGDLIESDDGGVYKRLNPAAPGGDWVSVIGDLAVGEFHSAVWDHVSHVAFGGTQDCGTSEQEFTGSLTWRTAFGGDGGKAAVEHTSPTQSVRYGSYQFLGAFNRRFMSDSNTMLNFEFPELIVEGTDPPRSIFSLDSAQFYSPIATNRVFAPGLAILTNRRVFVSYNRGDTCTDLGAPGGTPSAVVLGGRRFDTNNAHAIWVGSTNSRLLFRDTFTGNLQLNATYPGATNQTIRGIATSPEDYGTVVVADNTQVFLSRDVGTTWTNISGNLSSPDIREPFIRTVEYMADPFRGDTILVAGNNGVFATPAVSPGNWTKLGLGLPTAPVREMHFDATDNIVLVATLGRGNWILDITPCPADFNLDGGVDGSDIEAFFLAWEASENSADVNRDGGVDGSDVEYFFIRWEAGGC